MTSWNIAKLERKYFLFHNKDQFHAAIVNSPLICVELLRFRIIYQHLVRFQWHVLGLHSLLPFELFINGAFSEGWKTHEAGAVFSTGIWGHSLTHSKNREILSELSHIESHYDSPFKLSFKLLLNIFSSKLWKSPFFSSFNFQNYISFLFHPPNKNSLT